MAHQKPFATARTAIQKRSRSSILKRTLNDDDIIPDDLCDGNGGGMGGSQPKRVSFARTYKLKEFIKESDMLTLPSVDGTGVTEHLTAIGMTLAQPTATSSSGAAAAVSHTLCESVAMDITNMTSTSAAPAIVGEDVEDDFSAFLAAHDDDPPTQPAMKQSEQQQQPTLLGDADVEDNNDLLGGGDSSNDDDSESRQIRRQLFGSRLIVQMHQLLHDELLGERILPMPNYSDTSSCESLKLAAAATVAAAFGGSSSSGSSMTMITSSSSASATATVSQHYYQAYQQSELHHTHQHRSHHLRQQANFAASSTRCAATDLAPYHDDSLMSVSPRQPDQKKPLPGAPAGVCNDSLQERCRELEELFHTVCLAVSPGRGRGSSAAAAAAADSSVLALERSLFGATVGSDDMSIVTATVCQPSSAQVGVSNHLSIDDASNDGVDVSNAANPSCPAVPNLTCVGENCADGSSMMLDTVGCQESLSKHEAAAAEAGADVPSPPARNVAKENQDNKEENIEASSFMSLSTSASPNSRGPIPPTPTFLKSPAPSSSAAVGSPFRHLFEPAADSDSSLLLPPRSCLKSRTDSPMLVEDIMRRASDNLIGSMPSACYSVAGCFDNSAGDELFAEIQRVCDQLPLKLKQALLNRFQLERERCQVDVALGSLNSLQDATGTEDPVATLYRRRLGDAANEMVAKMLPDILAGERVQSMCRKPPLDQLARLRQRSRQLLMEKSRCMLSAALDSALAEASVDRTLRPPSSANSMLEDSLLRTPPARGEPSAEDCKPLFSARLVAECAFCTVQCSVSEDSPIVVLKYLHSRLHITCRVLLEQREARQTDDSHRPDTEMRASAGDVVRVLSFTCSIWKDGCSGLYGQFLPLFDSTAALLRDSLSYCCTNMPLAKFEQRAYNIVKPTYLLLLDFVRLQLAPCQVQLCCLAEKSVACSFVVMSSLKSFVASSREAAKGQTAISPQQPPPVYRVSVRIHLPDIDRFFSTQPVNRSPAGDSPDSVFSVGIEQDSCGGLFELVDADELSGRIKERIVKDQRHLLTSAHDACLQFLDSVLKAEQLSHDSL